MEIKLRSHKVKILRDIIELVLNIHPSSLVICTTSFFDLWDDDNFMTIGLQKLVVGILLLPSPVTLMSVKDYLIKYQPIMHNQTKLIKNFVALLGSVSVSTLVTLPGLAQNYNPSPNSNTSDSTNPYYLNKEFMSQAAQSDMTEIQSSRLALQRSQNRNVRSFANRMIQQHEQSTRILKQIASSKGVTLPKYISDQQDKSLLNQLSRLHGKNFDQAYMQGQVQAHQRTLAEFQKYQQYGQDPQLKAFANRIEPIVAQHLQMAQSMIATR